MIQCIEQNHAEYEQIVSKYIISAIEQGAPVNLLNGQVGHNLKFGNSFLEKILGSNFQENNAKYLVISIIGAQSSAKSTLLNFLFGCGFATSAGRCTKGLYMTIMKHPDGLNLVILDIEGLLSPGNLKDNIFDNRMCLMAFLCSHIVIINHKGDITKTLEEILGISIFAIKALKESEKKTIVMWSLRDQDYSNADLESIQRKMLGDVVKALQEQISKYLFEEIENVDEIKIKKETNELVSFIQLHPEDLFPFSSAYYTDKGENEVRLRQLSKFFPDQIMFMKNRILNTLSKS